MPVYMDRHYSDLFGKAVQLAARLCAHAEASQILAAQVVLDQCQDKAHLFGNAGETTPKGFDHAIRLYEIKWAKA